MTEDWNDRAKRGAVPRDPEEVSERIQQRAPEKVRLERLSDLLDAGHELVTAGRPKNPVRTGFSDLDAGMRRWGPREWTALAADSGIGKSTLAIQAALHVGASGRGAIYLNLEMSREMFGLRTTSNFAKIATARAASGDLRNEEKDWFDRGKRRLWRPATRIVMGNPKDHRRLEGAKALCVEACKQLEAEGTPCSLVVLDHILKTVVSVRNDKDGEGRARADFVKELADTCNAHVIALVHITRDSKRGNKMPTKNELAGSAWFDRDPDNILVFHQERTSAGAFDPKMKAILACQKARWGNPFRVELDYRGGFFYPWSLEPDESMAAAAEARRSHEDAPQMRSSGEGLETEGGDDDEI